MVAQGSISTIKRNRTKRLARLVTRAYYLHRRKRDDQMYTMICDEMVRLGGVYIKFLQGVLLRSEIMQRWQSNDRMNIFEDVRSEPIDVIAVLRSELPADKLSQIAAVQPQPFAAGSFGQVYYGTHVDGTPIIIKVLRPMVRELLRYDLKLLGAFGRSFFLKLYKNMDISMDAAIKEFKATTLRETDYIAEAEFAAELYEAYKNHPIFKIPRTYRELCTSHIIVQEYVAGLSVAQVIKHQEQGGEPVQFVYEQLGSSLDEQLITVGTELLLGVFQLPRVQGDPHPGNIRLLPENKIAMLDFGIAAHSPRNRAAFFRLLEEWYNLYTNTKDLTGMVEQFLRFFANDLYRAFKRLAKLMPPKPGGGSSDMSKEIGNVIQGIFTSAIGMDDLNDMLRDGKAIAVINEVVNKGNRFGFVMKIEQSEVLRASQTYMTLVESLGRREEVVPQVLKNVINQVNAETPNLRHKSEDDLSVGRAVDIVAAWLERVAERDPSLFMQLSKRMSFSPQLAQAAEAAAESVHPEQITSPEESQQEGDQTNA